jgi:hypothetical protein
MKKSFRQDVAPVIDIFPDLCGVAYNHRAIRRKMELLAAFDFRRVYLVVPPPGYPMFSNPWMDLIRLDNQAGNHAAESILDVGDPTFEHVYEAHRAGLQVFSVMKPYEGGGGYTVPHGRKSLLASRSVSCIGGERCGLDSFLRENPHMRVMRRPDPSYGALASQRITEIRMTFCLDRIEERVGTDRFRVFESKPDDSIAGHPARDVRIWESGDNGSFRPYGGRMTVEEGLVHAVPQDANGAPLFDSPRRCREVKLSGLDIGPESGYLAVTIGTDPDHLVAIPYSMITVRGEAGGVPVTCTPYVRSRCRRADDPSREAEEDANNWFDATYPATCDQKAEMLSAFPRNGFEFEWYGSGAWGNGWTRCACVGIARGKMTHMKGTHCEAYPEVREYWLEQVRKMLAMGFDGVDIRLQNHSGMVSDYASYGYNPPLLEAYRREHGAVIPEGGVDPLAMMRIRGRFFLQFVRDAAEAVHREGRTLQLHLRNAFENPKLSSSFGELGFWAMPKVLPDWEAMVDLADEVTIKDYNFGSYHPELSTRIKDRVSQRGKPLWVHCYIAQGGDLNPGFFDGVSRDPRVSGVLLYEMGHNPYAANPWVGLIEVKPHGEAVYNKEIHGKLVDILGYA